MPFSFLPSCCLRLHHSSCLAHPRFSSPSLSLAASLHLGVPLPQPDSRAGCVYLYLCVCVCVCTLPAGGSSREGCSLGKWRTVCSLLLLENRQCIISFSLSFVNTEFLLLLWNMSPFFYIWWKIFHSTCHPIPPPYLPSLFSAALSLTLTCQDFFTVAGALSACAAVPHREGFLLSLHTPNRVSSCYQQSL